MCSVRLTVDEDLSTLVRRLLFLSSISNINSKLPFSASDQNGLEDFVRSIDTSFREQRRRGGPSVSCKVSRRTPSLRGRVHCDITSGGDKAATVFHKCLCGLKVIRILDWLKIGNHYYDLKRSDRWPNARTTVEVADIATRMERETLSTEALGMTHFDFYNLEDIGNLP